MSQHFAQPDLCFDGLRIERRRALVKADHLCIDITRIGFEPQSARSENIVQRVRMIGRPCRLRADQLDIERVPDPTGDLVLHGKQIADLMVEPLGPNMCVGRGIDQLGIDAHLISRPRDASFEHIAHAQLAADLLRVDLLS